MGIMHTTGYYEVGYACVCVSVQALDGFMLVISSDGRILYTSESISNYLGLRQVRKSAIAI